MQLKDYQTETLDTLRCFLEEARVHGPSTAYAAITGEPEQRLRLRGYAGAYKPLDALPDTPYVCLRLPTGGGKTILAAHAVAVARDAWVEKDWPLVLWLTPTNTIRQQTVEALKSTRHAYRRVLDEAFSGQVRIYDIADFAHLRPQDIRQNCCILVGTIQTLRVTSTDGRKVYADNEEMEAHFSAALFNAPGLERKEEGDRPKFSFANLMHLHRPLMIVDEAHNAVTGLTREMQARANPCAIVEFTATPRHNSNILHSVRAQELKRARMIKLPIRLFEHRSWENAVNAAVAKRADLAEKAKEEADYIRPITLFQAEPKNRDVTVEVLKQHLIESEQVPERKIAVATGKKRDLDSIDLFDRDCPIEHVITVQALKEGWDCSFAYVFCTISRVRDATNVEQLLGRVIRMPYARRRRAPDLNSAWAFVSEPTFGEAARGLTDKLVGMGFDEEEVRDHVETESLLDDDDLFGLREEAFAYRVHLAPKAVETLQALDGVLVRETEGGEVEISIEGPFGEPLQDEISAVLPTESRQRFMEAVVRHRVEREAARSPAERDETLRIPGLAVEVQGEFDFADTDILIEDHNWTLSSYAAVLEEGELDIKPTARGFEIDLHGNRIQHGFLAEEVELDLGHPVEGWTPEVLVGWLDRKLYAEDIAQVDMQQWLSRLVTYLTGRRGLEINSLMHCKYILARAARDKIGTIRQQERDKVYQRALFSTQARVRVTFDHVFEFREDIYRGVRLHRGHWRPSKHFLGPNRVPAMGITGDGEEVQCAQALDQLPGLNFWLRNVSRDPASFRLPLAKGFFYPDFVAELKDDRLLVVEYKGAHIAENAETLEKRNIGALWERESAGNCLFIMVEKSVNGKNMRQQLLEKINVLDSLRP